MGIKRKKIPRTSSHSLARTGIKNGHKEIKSMPMLSNTKSVMVKIPPIVPIRSPFSFVCFVEPSLHIFLEAGGMVLMWLLYFLYVADIYESEEFLLLSFSRIMLDKQRRF